MIRSNWRRFALAMVIAGMLPACFAAAQEKPDSKAKPVATVGTEIITREDLNRAAADQLEKLDIQRLQSEANFRRNQHQVMENALNRLLEDKLLAAESGKLGVDRTELLAREVDRKVPEPKPEEVDVFYEANKARIPAPREQVMPQIVQYLRQQKMTRIRTEFFDRLKTQHGFTSNLEPLRFDIETAGHASRGPAGSPVTIVEFSDFKCDYCRGFNATLDQIQKDFGDKVRLVFRHYPLADIHPEAPKAAEAAMCAADQGKFWELHAVMFQEQDKLKVPDLKASAAKLGMDAAAFGQCLDSGRYAAKVKQDFRDGARAGVAGTPATFINGRFVAGARPYEDLATIVRDELKRKNVKE